MAGSCRPCQSNCFCPRFKGQSELSIHTDHRPPGARSQQLLYTERQTVTPDPSLANGDVVEITEEKLVTQDGEGMIIEGGIVRLYVKGVGWCSSTGADGETLMVKADPKVATNPMMPGSADTQKHGDKIEKVARGGNTRKKKNSASTTERTSNPMFAEHANPMLGSASEESASEESDPED